MGWKRLFRSGKTGKDSDAHLAINGPSPGGEEPQTVRDTAEDIPPPPPPPPAGPFYERDNRARRLLREPAARAFLDDCRHRRDPSPLLRYAFATEGEAVRALESLSCVHTARDTGNLVCTVELTLGRYRRRDGLHELLLAGHGLTGPLWTEARRSFDAGGGRRQEERPPAPWSSAEHPFPSRTRVTFVREFHRLGLSGASRRCRIYRADSAVAARAFLHDPDTRVAPRHHEIVVETPEGRFVKDGEGIRQAQE